MPSIFAARSWLPPVCRSTRGNKIRSNRRTASAYKSSVAFREPRVDVSLQVQAQRRASSDNVRCGRCSGGKNSGNRIGPAACNNACFSTLCNSRTLPGQVYRRSVPSFQARRSSRPCPIPGYNGAHSS